MRIDSNGQAVLSPIEEVQASIAEDGLDAIQSVLTELKNAIGHLAVLRRTRTLHFSQSDLQEFSDKLEDAVADLLANDWSRLVTESRSADRPRQLPNIDADIEAVSHIHVSKNPSTMMLQGDL